MGSRFDELLVCLAISSSGCLLVSIVWLLQRLEREMKDNEHTMALSVVATEEKERLEAIEVQLDTS